MMSSSSWKRPKLNIPKTMGEKIGDGIGLTLYIGSILFLAYLWKDLPDKVPAHYNFAGEVDRWGSKWELWIFPFLGLFIFLFMTIFEKFPETHNYPKRFNESNAAQFYLISRKLINEIKNISLIIFAILMFESAAIAMGWWKGLGIWLLPIFIIGVGIPIVKMLLNQRKIK